MLNVSKNGKAMTFADALLPSICLQLTGGGYSAKQVADAMLLQSKVVVGGKAVKYKGVTIQKVENIS